MSTRLIFNMGVKEKYFVHINIEISVILPANDMSGVNGTATIHMMTSDMAKFRIKKFVTECMLALRITTVITGSSKSESYSNQFTYKLFLAFHIKFKYYTVNLGLICKSQGGDLFSNYLKLHYNGLKLSDSCLVCCQKILSKI